ncbi:MAG: endonuclease Q family protein [Candidatus Pacearchaeota archaeon]
MKDKIIADLHIHSRYSRATSKDLTIKNLVKWAKIKGINLLGTGDFTHDKWLEEIRNELYEENGFLIPKEDKNSNIKFIFSGEISLVYSKDNKGRRVHLVLLAPDFEIVNKINKYLDKKGRRDYDGRPIFNISCKDFVKDIKSISEDIEIIPAHCMTPWFGIFGSKSGFNSLKEAFEEQEDKIYAVETGMSADPEMLWKFSFLNKKTILSFSDSHSYWPWRLGREATIFNPISNYKDLIEQIRNNNIYATIEVNPAYGKYHYDGHRFCNFSCNPEITKELNNICPKCNKELTIGVENRTLQLADQDSYMFHSKKPFFKVLPLHEIISLVYEIKMNSNKVWKIYNEIIDKFENEFNVLLNVSKEELLRNKFEEKLINAIIDNRIGNIKVIPGYDGVYGKAILKGEQKTLF